MARRHRENNENTKEKKKHGRGCVIFLILFVLLMIAGGIGAYLYTDYLDWTEQKEEFSNMINAAEKITVYSTDKTSAEENLETVINLTKKTSELTNLSISCDYTHDFDSWTPGNEVTLTFSGSLQSKNPFLETGLSEESTVKLICDAQALTMVPAFVTQTGVKADYTNYNYFFDLWHGSTNQRAIADHWNNQGRTSQNDIATLSGYYLVAVRPIFGKCGDIIQVVLEDGTMIECIIADEKGDDAGNDWGHVKSTEQISLVEFEVIGNAEDDQAPDFVTPEEWEGKRVFGIVNKGTAEELEDVLVD